MILSQSTAEKFLPKKERQILNHKSLVIRDCAGVFAGALVKENARHIMLAIAKSSLVGHRSKSNLRVCKTNVSRAGFIQHSSALSMVGFELGL